MPEEGIFALRPIELGWTRRTNMGHLMHRLVWMMRPNQQGRRRKYTEAEDVKNNEREGAKCRNFVRRKSLRKETQKVKREWEARTGGSAKRQSDQQASGRKVLYQPQELAKMENKWRRKCELTASNATPILWKPRRCKPKGFGSRGVEEKVWQNGRRENR